MTAGVAALRRAWTSRPSKDGSGLTRRHLQLGLGVLWLLDAALQFQPYMFSTAFARDMIAASANGQPRWVAVGVHWAARLMSSAPVVSNAAFATVQLAIAVLILSRRTARFGLGASVGWALGVWYFGEGLGGITSGQASLVSGAPGAVILYALVAVLAWPPRAGLDRHGDSSASVSRFAGAAWAAVWIGGAVLEVLPAQASPGSLAATVGSNIQSAGRLAGADHTIAAAIAGLGRPSVVLVVALFSAVGVSAIYSPRARRIGAVVGAVLAGTIWLFGQNLGDLGSGQSTDPNSAPLLGLLALAVFGSARAASARQTPASTAAAGTPSDPPPGRTGGHPRSPAITGPARWLRLAALVTVPGVLAGWASIAAQAPIPSMPVGMAGPSMSGMTMDAMASAPAQPATSLPPAEAGPSASARMICGSETRHNVALLLGLPGTPSPSPRWADRNYICAYHEPAGFLVLSVEESANRVSARQYFLSLRRSLGATRTLGGMAGLGLPAYQSDKGVVVFLKDSDTLVVDATGLAGRIGPTDDTTSDVAYSLATDIIACWRGQ